MAMGVIYFVFMAAAAFGFRVAAERLATGRLDAAGAPGAGMITHATCISTRRGRRRSSG